VQVEHERLIVNITVVYRVSTSYRAEALEEKFQGNMPDITTGINLFMKLDKSEINILVVLLFFSCLAIGIH
jgi:hypothetical protein